MEFLLGRKQAAEFLELPPHQKILDIATVTGTLANELAKLGHTVVGIDSSSEMISQAKKKYINQKTLSFEIADATRIPFKNSEFDAVSISFALHDMPFETQTQVIKQMKRVTMPNGHMLITDYNEPRNHRMAKLFFPLIKATESHHLQDFTERGLENLLQGLGLKVARSTTYLGLIQIAVVDY